MGAQQLCPCGAFRNRSACNRRRLCQLVSIRPKNRHHTTNKHTHTLHSDNEHDLSTHTQYHTICHFTRNSVLCRSFRDTRLSRSSFPVHCLWNAFESVAVFVFAQLNPQEFTATKTMTTRDTHTKAHKTTRRRRQNFACAMLSCGCCDVECKRQWCECFLVPAMPARFPETTHCRRTVAFSAQLSPQCLCFGSDNMYYAMRARSWGDVVGVLCRSARNAHGKCSLREMCGFEQCC